MAMVKRRKLRALILSRRDSGEADRIVTLLTREAGLLQVIAKGVRRIPSRRGGHLEPYTEVLCLVTGLFSQPFLAAVEPLDTFPALRQDPVALAQAVQLTWRLRRLVADGQGSTMLYTRLRDVWRLLPTVPAAKRELLGIAFTIHVLAEAGLTPNLSVCQRCRRPVPEGAAVVSGTTGGWHCLTHASSMAAAAASLSARGLAALRFITTRPDQASRLRVRDDEAKQLAEAMNQYVAEVAGSPPLSLVAPPFRPYGYARP